MPSEMVLITECGCPNKAYMHALGTAANNTSTKNVNENNILYFVFNTSNIHNI